MNALLKTGDPFVDMREQIKWSDGTLHWYRFSVSVVQNEIENSELNFLVSVDDLTDTQRNERLKDFSAAILDASTASTDLDTFYRLIHTELKKVISADNYFIALVNEKKTNLTFLILLTKEMLAMVMQENMEMV